MQNDDSGSVADHGLGRIRARLPYGVARRNPVAVDAARWRFGTQMTDLELACSMSDEATKHMCEGGHRTVARKWYEAGFRDALKLQNDAKPSLLRDEPQPDEGPQAESDRIDNTNRGRRIV